MYKDKENTSSQTCSALDLQLNVGTYDRYITLQFGEAYSNVNDYERSTGTGISACKAGFPCVCCEVWYSVFHHVAFMGTAE